MRQPEAPIPAEPAPDAMKQIAEELLALMRGVGWFSIAIALALIFVLRVALPREHRTWVRAPLLFLFMHVALKVGGTLLDAGSAAASALQLASLLALLLSISRSGFLLVFDVLLGRRFGKPLPTIVRDVLQGLIYAGAALVTLRAAGVEAGSLLTTSALLTAVIGLSLQDTLGNVFAGLAIQAQTPFDVGDWIQFDEDASHIGRVVEINWRATKVKTLDDVEIVIPNGVLAKAPIRNFCKPTTLMRRSVFVLCPYDVHPAHVQEVVLAGLRGAANVETEPAPSVLVRDFSERGVKYWVRYYTRDFMLSEGTDADVRTRIWYALHRAHIPIPYPVQTLQLAGQEEENNARRERIESRRRMEALKRVEIFQPLSEEAIASLAKNSENRLYGDGEFIIRQGDEGDELFVIEHGVVAVVREAHDPDEAEEDLVVAELGRGEFFGEMSLMTGARRAASIRTVGECDVLVVSKAGFSVVLEKYPEIAEQISHVLARRQAKLATHSEAGAPMSRRNVDAQSGALLAKIRDFFAL